MIREIEFMSKLEMQREIDKLHKIIKDFQIKAQGEINKFNETLRCIQSGAEGIKRQRDVWKDFANRFKEQNINLKEKLKKLMQLGRWVTIEADMYQNDEGDGMKLADAITAFEQFDQEIRGKRNE